MVSHMVLEFHEWLVKNQNKIYELSLFASAMTTIPPESAIMKIAEK